MFCFYVDGKKTRIATNDQWKVKQNTPKRFWSLITNEMVEKLGMEIFILESH